VAKKRLLWAQFALEQTFWRGGGGQRYLCHRATSSEGPRGKLFTISRPKQKDGTEVVESEDEQELSRSLKQREDKVLPEV